MEKILDINEGNAFVAAAKKAKEEGKDSFELNGKSYKVTSKATKKEEPKENIGATNMTMGFKMNEEKKRIKRLIESFSKK